MSAKKYLRMPTAQSVAAKNESEERMMMALRKHVLYERQRKKQEQEAEVEEERLRKEREARERRDVMTLGQTREKIQALELRHRELTEQKEELFLQLKRLLNEDENRKKQQQKESNDIYVMQQNMMAQAFMPHRPMAGGQDRPQPQGPPQGNNNPTNNNNNNNNNAAGSGNGPPGGSSMSSGSGAPVGGGGGGSMHNRPGGSSSGGPPNISNTPPVNKRTRSPSPTPPHGHYYKGGGGIGGSAGGQGAPGGGQPGQQYQHAPKLEEGRRVGEVSRAVLWNKQSQYSNTVPSSMFYQGPPMPPNPAVDPSGRFFTYSAIPSQHMRPNYVDMAAHMAAAAAVGQVPKPQDLDYAPPGSDRNLVSAYHHHQQQQQQQQQTQQQQQQDRNKQQAPPPQPQQHQQIVFDVLRWQQEQGKLPPGAPPSSIARGYMKRGMND